MGWCRRLRSGRSPRPELAPGFKLGIESPRFMPDAGLFRFVVLSPRRFSGIDRQPGLKPAAGRSISRLMGDELIATSGRAMH